VDAIVAAMRILTQDRLVVAGEGPLQHDLRAAAPSNVVFMTGVSDARLRWLYANAGFLLGAATEDFGLAPVEAMAFGTPAVVARKAGYLETVIEGETGLFFDHVEPGAIASAVRMAGQQTWSTSRLRRHAERFSEAAFSAALARVLADIDGP
jgi:glycosyltransferase involved in cell wall biosynthesis